MMVIGHPSHPSMVTKSTMNNVQVFKEFPCLLRVIWKVTPAYMMKPLSLLVQFLSIFLCPTVSISHTGSPILGVGSGSICKRLNMSIKSPCHIFSLTAKARCKPKGMAIVPYEILGFSFSSTRPRESTPQSTSCCSKSGSRTAGY